MDNKKETLPGEDIVEGSLLAAEDVSDCTPINLGTGKRYKKVDVVKMIFDILGWKSPKFEFDNSKPVGPLSRALDNSRAKEILGWRPRFALREGLAQTIDWHYKNHKAKEGMGASADYDDMKMLVDHI